MCQRHVALFVQVFNIFLSIIIAIHYYQIWVYYSLGVRKKNNRPKKIPKGGPFGFYRISKGPPFGPPFGPFFGTVIFFFGRLNCNIPSNLIG